uniref:protein-tyrosine-phosphatase n=1 Tax=Acrobeloides nanus TaxID=290746 RepID=A0A914BX51_9BILA
MAIEEPIDQRKLMSDFLLKYGTMDEATKRSLNFQFLVLVHLYRGRRGSGKGSQAPLVHTIDDWWNMICKLNVKVIVMLCKCFEADVPKCDQYWPSEVKSEKKFETVKVVLETEESHNEYIYRNLRVQCPRYGEREVHQLHYTEWPDHGCPNGENYILELIEHMNSLHDDLDSPLLLHCSAGCGRTGTVIAANIIRETINKKKLKSLDLKELVMDLRRQRSSMVQTPGQYQLLHRCVAHYCKQAIGDVHEDQSTESKNNGIVHDKASKTKPAISPKPNLEDKSSLPTTNGIVVNNAPLVDLNNDSSDEPAALANENSPTGEGTIFRL